MEAQRTIMTGRYIVTIQVLKQICVNADGDVEAGLLAVLNSDDAWEIDSHRVEDCTEITGDYDIGFIPEVIV